jgi:RHS repeat-associated protein
MSVSYYANDMAKSLTRTIAAETPGTEESGPAEVEQTTSYGLDPTGRINTITATTEGSDATRTQYRFAGGSDAPSVIRTSTDAGETWATTRYVTIPGIGMAAQISAGTTTLDLPNLHGDSVGTIETGPGVDTYTETDEYGNPLGEANDERRYGYLGTHQRSAGRDTLGGLTLMGARLYNPSTGHFLSTDRVLGGNETKYSYPVDPVNSSDVSGMCPPCAVAAALGISVAQLYLLVAVAALLSAMIMNYSWRRSGSTFLVNGFSIPFPNINAPKAKDKSKYIVYKIVYWSRTSKSWKTWKYGISSVGMSRPYRQLPKCRSDMNTDCKAVKMYDNVRGWFAARTIEATLILKYTTKYGHCPPGHAWWNCR